MRASAFVLEVVAKRHERRQDKAKCDEKAEHMRLYSSILRSILTQYGQAQ